MFYLLKVLWAATFFFVLCLYFPYKQQSWAVQTNWRRDVFEFSCFKTDEKCIKVLFNADRETRILLESKLSTEICVSRLWKVFVVFRFFPFLLSYKLAFREYGRFYYCRFAALQLAQVSVIFDSFKLAELELSSAFHARRTAYLAWFYTGSFEKHFPIMKTFPSL